MGKAWNSTLSTARKPMKRSAFKRKPYKLGRGVLAKKKNAKLIRPKMTKADVWRQYGLERPSKPRYSGLKGIYWHLLSKKVRMRDFDAFGTCINCDRAVESWQEFQGGHFISAERGGWLLLFDERNINGECPGCNKYDKQKLGYEQNLDARYGVGTVAGLKKIFWDSKKETPAKEWSQLEYHREILRIQAELAH